MSFVDAMPPTVVIPAKAGIHPSELFLAFLANRRLGWMAAFAAMTVLADEVAR